MLVTNFRLKYVLYRVVLACYQLVDTGRLHPVRERAKRALAGTVDYIDSHMADALGFETQRELLDYALSQTKAAGHYLEFGVFSGGTIRHMAKYKPAVTFHGFDSFEGLPEAWAGFSLGSRAFTRGGRLPRVPGNVVLHKGWFRDTIPAWCGHDAGPVAFLHIDCDLYSSTVDIFHGLAERLQPGTVIVFDEYFNYPGWERHEFKAWQEFVSDRRIEYAYLGYARQQVALRIVGIGAPR
jgi:predicted O-methyltransferase YrrM